MLKASALPQELHAGDEDEDEHDLTAEEASCLPTAQPCKITSPLRHEKDQLRRNYEEILGAMMKASTHHSI